MDPITMAIVGTLVSTSLSVIPDAYKALRAAIAEKCGLDSETLKALKEVEKNPSSEGRQMILSEEIQRQGLEKDSEILRLAIALADKIQPTSIIRTGSHSIVVTTTKGNVTVNQENTNG